MAAVEVVACWSVRRRRARAQACTDCGTVFDGVACPACGLVSDPVPVAVMALVVETEAGARRLVVVERAPGGRWFAARGLPATDEAVPALRRQYQPADDLALDGWAVGGSAA